jgi:predicted 2-oxoglutarate/Fe(II)-dependent dioxygenase YbiX
MMLHVPRVLTSEQVAECRRLLDTAEWTDGKATVGEQGALVKRNRQLPEHSPVGRQLGELILTALTRNPLFFSAALPLKTVPPLFNRYEGGEQYGTHIDGAVRAVPGSSHFIRTDLSSTLFLTDPRITTAASSWCSIPSGSTKSNYRRETWSLHLGQPASRESGDARRARELVLLDAEHGRG